MTYEQIEFLFKSFALLLGIAITYVIKPYIDSKISVNEQETIKRYIEMGVRCAQQIYTPEQWKEKKNYVMSYVQDLMVGKLNIRLTDKELSTLIESAVYELKNEVNNGN